MTLHKLDISRADAEAAILRRTLWHLLSEPFQFSLIV